MPPPIVQLTIAYGAGLWAGLVFLAPRASVVLLGIAGLIVTARRGWVGVLAGAVALGVGSGVVRAQFRTRTCRIVWAAGPQTATLVIHDAPGRRGTTRATVAHAAAGCRGTLRLRLAPRAAPAGARVVAVGVYRTSGVFRVHHARTLRSARAWRFVVRDRVATRIRRLYGPRAGLVEALVLGRRDDIDPRLRNDFADAGLAHLLAISGLHVGIIASWVAMMLRLCGLRRTAWLWTAAATWCYVGFLGFLAPATRAAFFVTIYGIARIRQRHPPVSAVLAVAVLGIVTIEPTAVTAIGAWLSVAAVWGLRWGTGGLAPRMRRNAVVRLGAASFGANIATAPITAYAFGTVAPAGLVANLAAVPLAGIAVPGVFASLAAGGPIAGGSGLVLAALERVAALAAQLPGGHLAGTPGIRFAAPWIMLLAALVWVRRRRLPWGRVGIRLLAAGACVSWVLAALAAVSARERTGDLAIHVLDVGQGDAIALRTPRGHWLLIDAGPRGPTGDAGWAVVVPFLRRRGVRQLAALVLSHGDADHVGGAPAVLRALDPTVVLEPGQPLATPLYRRYLAALDGAGIPWRAARAGDTLTVDSVTIAVLHPSSEWMAHQLEPNENSVVLWVSYRCFSAVLTGDIGWPAESILVARVGAADVLKVGHHGSARGTAASWLDAVRPRVAVISVGQNRYGHPAAEVLERFRTRGVPVFRTDRGGTVTIRTNGRYLEVVQGQPTTLAEMLRCKTRRLSRSSGSSWSRNACTRAPLVSFPTCSTTSRWPPR